MFLTSSQQAGLSFSSPVWAADTGGNGRRRIERQGVLKGYVRADEVWKFAVSALSRTRDPNGRILELIGFDMKGLEATLKSRSDEESAGKDEQLSEKIRSHYINELWRVREEMLEISAAVAIHGLFLDGAIRVWHCSDGLERYLTADEFRVNPGGAHMVYGQLLQHSALDTPYSSWRTGFASIGDTNGTIDDPGLFGRTLMVAEDDFAAARRLLIERFPPTPAALADDENSARFDRELPGWTDDLLARDDWNYGEALWWIALRDPKRMAEHLLRQNDYYEGKGTGWVAAMVAVTITPDENADAASDDFRARYGSIVCFNPITSLNKRLLSGHVRASGRYEDGGKRVTIDRSYWNDLDLRDGPSRVWGRSLAILKHRVLYDGMSLEGCWFDVLFSRDDLIREFPPAQGLPGMAASNIGDTNETSNPADTELGICLLDRERILVEDWASLPDEILLSRHMPKLPALYVWQCADGKFAKSQICDALFKVTGFVATSADTLEESLSQDGVKTSASAIRTIRKKMIGELAAIARQQIQQNQQSR
jgi:hypothetical protein